MCVSGLLNVFIQVHYLVIHQETIPQLTEAKYKQFKQAIEFGVCVVKHTYLYKCFESGEIAPTDEYEVYNCVV